MSFFTTLLFWAPLAFGFVVAASYVGTMLALRRYHDDAELSASDLIRVEDDTENDR